MVLTIALQISTDGELSGDPANTLDMSWLADVLKPEDRLGYLERVDVNPPDCLNCLTPDDLREHWPYFVFPHLSRRNRGSWGKVETLPYLYFLLSSLFLPPAGERSNMQVLIAVEEKGALGYVMRLVKAENWANIPTGMPMPVSDVARATRAIKILTQAAADQEFELVERGSVEERVHEILDLFVAGKITKDKAHALIAGEFFLGDNGEAAQVDIYATREWVANLVPDEHAED